MDARNEGNTAARKGAARQHGMRATRSTSAFGAGLQSRSDRRAKAPRQVRLKENDGSVSWSRSRGQRGDLAATSFRIAQPHPGSPGASCRAWRPPDRTSRSSRRSRDRPVLGNARGDRNGRDCGEQAERPVRGQFLRDLSRSWGGVRGQFRLNLEVGQTARRSGDTTEAPASAASSRKNECS